MSVGGINRASQRGTTKGASALKYPPTKRPSVLGTAPGGPKYAQGRERSVLTWIGNGERKTPFMHQGKKMRWNFHGVWGDEEEDKQG